MKKLIMTVMAAAGIAMAASAEVSFSYSGQLRDEHGGPVEKLSQNIEFKLYNVATGGSALWAQSMAIMLDTNGYFSVELSDGCGSKVGTIPDTGLDSVLANNGSLFIGLKVVGSSGEIEPRQRLLAVPSAIFAQDVKEAKQSFTVKGLATFNEVQIGDGINGVTLSTNGTIKAKTLELDGQINANGASMKVGSIDVTGAIKKDGKELLPKGVIVMWSGSTNSIPTGWALCDGNNGTPNLKDRFVVGAGGEYKVNDKGGAKTVTLSEEQMPEHRHRYVNEQIAGNLGSDNAAFPEWKYDMNFRASSDHKYGVDISTGKAGGNQPHENRPPYYALAYIMKL